VFDRTTAKLSTQITIIKFCNNLLGKSSLSSIELKAIPHNLHFHPQPENLSNPCGVSVPPAQTFKLNTSLFDCQINPD
jgi:hypothetical protein